MALDPEQPSEITMSSQPPRKRIFVTGGASGIGRATVERFHQEGWQVAAADRDSASLDDLRADLDGAVETFPLDVTNRLGLGDALQTFTLGGALDVMFNNAGIGHVGWFEDVDPAAHDRLIQINLGGVLNGIYAALPHLRQAENSLCFSTSSSSAIFGIARIAVYSATKFAVKGLTEALSVEFARPGVRKVRVADVLPGLIDTAILDTTEHHPPPGEEVEERGDARANAPADGPFRLIQPSEVAASVWNAYHDESGRLHWYVPAELEMMDKARAGDLEAMRDGWVEQLGTELSFPESP